MPTHSPERLDCRDEKPTREVRKAAEAALAAGRLVAMPTETVYGIAARADSPEALSALRAFKGQAAGRALTWHVASRKVLEHFPLLRPLTQRLAERYWPGPLTLVLAGVPKGLEGAAVDGWTGVRLPAHQGTVGVLDALPFPVVMSSANRAGEPPLGTADEVLEQLGAGLALVLDGGPVRLGEASGVLAVGPGRFELLREGLLPIEDLRRTAGLAIAFACTGNTCRSPMAEGLAKQLLAERLGLGGNAAGVRRLHEFGFEVGSMGVATGPGYPASPEGVTVMQAQGIDISRHASRLASAAEVAAYDRVYGLTRGHVEALRQVVGHGRANAKRIDLLDPEGNDVADPIGGSIEVYQRCADQIRDLIRRRLHEWA